jgi:hypothetical protein
LLSDKVNPPCPACGSSATLPFENEENARAEQTFSEIILTIFLLFLLLFTVFLLFLLSHASLPSSLLLILGFFLLWRKNKKSRPPHRRRGQYVCLDCSRNFKA